MSLCVKTTRIVVEIDKFEVVFWECSQDVIGLALLPENHLPQVIHKHIAVQNAKKNSMRLDCQNRLHFFPSKKS